jgi:branched-chain amino acid transport system ATP-binding protein
MVSVGRALMADAWLYLVDEPSLGLAPKISVNLVAALCEIDLGDGAMIIAEQNVPLLEGRVDRVLGMHAGELKLDAGESLGDIPPSAGVHL